MISCDCPLSLQPAANNSLQRDWIIGNASNQTVEEKIKEIRIIWLFDHSEIKLGKHRIKFQDGFLEL